MPIIHINNAVWFSPNYGVHAEQELIKYSPEEVYRMLESAFSHMKDELLVDACCGGIGPFKNYVRLSLEEYLELKEKFERELDLKKATEVAKQIHTKIRRNQYSAQRAQLVLQMLDTGTPYVCVHPDCNETVALTVDHIHPLSKGGSDEISNLQFMCHGHNSKKGDRT